MAKNLYNKGKRDQNEGEILRLLKSYNIKATQLPPGAGADLLIWMRPLFLVEVKNPAQPLCKRQLTSEEEEAMTLSEQIGIPYYVIETVDEMNELIGNYIRRMP